MGGSAAVANHAEILWGGDRGQSRGEIAKHTRTYRSHLDNYVLPAVGALRIKEGTAGRLDLAIEAIRVSKGERSRRRAEACCPE
jgi:hypothetical protein